MDPLASDPPKTSDQEGSAVWGLIATLLWTALIVISFEVVQIIAGLIYVIVTMRGLPRDQVAAAFRSLSSDGLLLSVSTFATLLICVPLVVGLIKLKRGSKLKDYLALNVPRLRQFLQWSLITSVFLGLSALILLRHERKVPDVLFNIYSSTDSKWHLWLALVVAAPIYEEIVFRGFIFKGLAASRLRWSGATIVTSLLWTATHGQYDRFELCVLFAAGLVLGAARALTNSTLLTIWLHCLANLLACIQLEFVLRRFPVNN